MLIPGPDPLFLPPGVDGQRSGQPQPAGSGSHSRGMPQRRHHQRRKVSPILPQERRSVHQNDLHCPGRVGHYQLHVKVC